MSKEVKILKYVEYEIGNDDYYSTECKITEDMTDWETISDDDYNLLVKYFHRFNTYPKKYALAVKNDSQDENMSLSKLLEKCNNIIEEDKKAEARLKKEKAERAKKLTVKQKERDLKKAKALLEKHGLEALPNE